MNENGNNNSNNSSDTSGPANVTDKVPVSKSEINNVETQKIPASNASGNDNEKAPNNQSLDSSPSDNENNSQIQVSEQTANENSLSYIIANWSAFSVPERKEKFSQLMRTEAEELFFNLKPSDQAELIAEASPLEKRSWIRLLAPDDVADLIQESEPELRPEMLNLLDPQTRRDVTALLAYAEDKAGGLMSSQFVRLRPEMTVDEAISYLRAQAKSQIETIYYCYVVAPDQTLLGVVSFRELFSAASTKKMSEIMKVDLIKIPVGLDQEQVAKTFSMGDFIALPVIDEWGHIKGIVTFDDIANVQQEEATEDIQKYGAVQALEAPYFQTGLWELLQKRAGWLVILFFGEMLTASAMGIYFDEIQKAAVLSLFIPLIISSGGNAGSQASTLIVRSLALGEIRLRDWWRVATREIFMGTALGVILGLIGIARIYLWPAKETLYGKEYPIISLTVGLSVLGTVLWGTISGSMLPFILKSFKLDPAVASAPFVATLVDVCGLVTYFTVAAFLLSGTLL